MAGRRRSASMRMTLAPPWASAVARPIAVVVLPSPGAEPVSRTACGLLPARATRKVRSER